MEKVKHLLKELRVKKDKLDETASDLPKTEGRPIVDEKFKDLEERFEKLDHSVNDKKEQVFANHYSKLISLQILKFCLTSWKN